METTQEKLLALLDQKTGGQSKPRRIDWRNAVVEWCRTTKRINIFDDPHREPTLPSKMGGAYYAAIRERDYGDETVALDMMMQFHSITVRDGVPIDVAHAEFMKVSQYRDRISPDSPGM